MFKKEKKYDIYFEENFNYDNNRLNMLEELVKMLKSGIEPICPQCGQPLISNTMIEKIASSNKYFDKNNIRTVDGLIRHINEKEVLKVIYHSLQAEHIIAKENGGTNHFANLVLMHPRCNTAKGKIPAIDYIFNEKGELMKDKLNDVQNRAVYLSKGDGFHVYETFPFKKQIPDFVYNGKDTVTTTFLNSVFIKK